jgi:peptide/nickel transport system permease protein
MRFVLDLAREPLGGLSLAILALLAGLALLGPMLWGRDPLAVDLSGVLRPPGPSHPLGTDQYGRDLLARFMAGARLSLVTGALTVVVGAAVGTAVGMIAGYSVGLVDHALMRIMDAVLAFPPLMLAMAIAMAMGGGGLVSAVVGVSLATIPWYARVIRSRVLEVREFEFVDAARVCGGTAFHILRRHVFPHVVPIVMIQGTLTFGYAILTVAGLGFVGFGASPPTPEWGVMITEGQRYALSGQWWVAFAPGLGILMAVVATNLLGDRIRDVLEPWSM